MASEKDFSFEKHCKKEERQMTLSNVLRVVATLLFSFAIYSANRWVSTIDSQFDEIAKKFEQMANVQEQRASRITALEAQRSEDFRRMERIEQKLDRIIESLSTHANR